MKPETAVTLTFAMEKGLAIEHTAAKWGLSLRVAAVAKLCGHPGG